MFSTVRYFIKTSVAFLAVGLLNGVYLSLAKHVFLIPYGYELVTAHAHLILVGSVMMMIMGVALWFFPRPEKDDARYSPRLISAVYWLMTIATASRFLFQAALSLSELPALHAGVALTSVAQVIAMLLFFFAMWGRIRPVGSHLREAKGERF